MHHLRIGAERQQNGFGENHAQNGDDGAANQGHKQGRADHTAYFFNILRAPGLPDQHG